MSDLEMYDVSLLENMIDCLGNLTILYRSMQNNKNRSGLNKNDYNNLFNTVENTSKKLYEDINNIIGDGKIKDIEQRKITKFKYWGNILYRNYP